MNDHQPIFTVENVSFAYDARNAQLEALAGVNLTIQPGESAVILGANGSGKSTLLKLLDGLYFPTEGSIRMQGQALTEQAFREDAFNFAFRRKVGLVFQDTDVQLFSPSVLEEVAFAPLQLGLSRAEAQQRVEMALASLRIEHLANRAPHRLSGGEKRRVALASVLSLDPQVWLLDEPTTGLDPRSQSWLVEFVQSQSQAGKTIVTATHDLEIAADIATRVYVFDETHTIIASGAPDDILCDHELLHRSNLAHYHMKPSLNVEC